VREQIADIRRPGQQLAPLRSVPDDVLAAVAADSPLQVLRLGQVPDDRAVVRRPNDGLIGIELIRQAAGALEAFADFFGIDPDLVEAAAESGADHTVVSKDELRKALAAIPEREKVELLLRVTDGDSYAGVELRTRLRRKNLVPAIRRTAGTLRMRALEIREERERADAERREAERRRQGAEAEKARRVRLKILKQRGASVWREIEDGIERRNPAGYDQAISLLFDLQALALEEGSQDDFSSRVASIRAHHEKKGKFIERLNKLGGDSDEGMA